MTFEGYGIALRPVTPCDLSYLRRWRNSPRISHQMLDRSYITPRKQRLWYEQMTDRVDQAHWVVWRKGVRTGYVNIKGKGPLESQAQVDVGLYVADSKVRQGLLGYAMAMMQMDIVFQELSVKRVQMVVLEDNRRVRHFNRQLGYQEDGCKDGVVALSICQRDYEAAKARLLRYFPHHRKMTQPEAMTDHSELALLKPKGP
ncbi:MAG: GNAT family N-acetyltransferase [Thermodesulfobacteriota bacterium]|nr:GNAT family N-acetyltransferase [Thermodesulfobacteriota bacterium]